jgi:MFS transporter, DHA1 family, multidrug resistance protein
MPDTLAAAGAETTPSGRRAPGFVEFVTLVALMMGFTAFAVDNALPAFPDIARHFSVANANDLQLVVYVYMVGFGVAQLVYGPMSDVLGRRPAFLAGLCVFLIGCLLALVATSLETLLAARFVQGLGAAAGRVLAVAIVRDRFGGREMARVMSLTLMIFITVPILAPAIGSLLLLVGDWRTIFAAMFVLAAIIGIWFVRRMPETLHPEYRMPFSWRRIGEGVRDTATCRAALGYSTAFGCLFGCVMGYIGSSEQIFAGEVYGLGSLFPLAFASVAGLMGLASLVNSRLVRRYGMRRISHLSLGVFICLSAVQCGLALAFAGRPPLILFGLVLGTSQFFSSLAMPNFNAIAMEPLGRIAGTASSMVGLYTTLVGAGCGVLIGRFFDGTVLPLGIGYLLLSVAAITAVLVTERGRLSLSAAPEVAR